MRKLILWIPVLMVGSLVYWTIALNVGGMSLLTLSAFAIPGEQLLIDQGDRDDLGNDQGNHDSYQPIVVHVSDGNEAASGPSGRELMDDSVTVEVVSDRDVARSDQRGAGDRNGRGDQGPGETAF